MIERIAFVASPHEEAVRHCAIYTHLYGQVAPDEADVIVALGGDGFMLRALHQYQPLGKPIYGINCGSIGFLMNSLPAEDLPPSLLNRLRIAQKTTVHPLKMVAETVDGESITALAINEVSLLRQTYQAGKIQILINSVERLDELICDGVLVATPAGSTAYNLSAHGPIIPLGVSLLALTPISPFRPRRWRGALIQDDVTVTFIVKKASERPMSATADSLEVRNVSRVTIEQDKTVCHTLLFDPHHNLEDRILREQFME